MGAESDGGGFRTPSRSGNAGRVEALQVPFHSWQGRWPATADGPLEFGLGWTDGHGPW
jgi:hypothetical protein